MRVRQRRDGVVPRAEAVRAVMAPQAEREDLFSSRRRRTRLQGEWSSDVCSSDLIEFYPGQKLSKDEPNVTWDHNASPETIQKVKEKLAAFKVKAVNYGVVRSE